MLEMVCHEPPVYRTAGTTKPTSSPIDITNQKFGFIGLSPGGTYFLSVITVGNIPAIRKKYHRKQLGHERACQCAQIGPSGHIAHEQCLENRPTEGEAQSVFDDHFGDTGKCRGHLKSLRRRGSRRRRRRHNALSIPAFVASAPLCSVRGAQAGALGSREHKERPQAHRCTRSAVQIPISSPEITGSGSDVSSPRTVATPRPTETTAASRHPTRSSPVSSASEIDARFADTIKIRFRKLNSFLST